MEVIELKQSKTGGIAVCLFLYIPVVWAALLYRSANRGRTRDGEGHGSAAWVWIPTNIEGP